MFQIFSKTHVSSVVAATDGSLNMLFRKDFNMSILTVKTSNSFLDLDNLFKPVDEVNWAAIRQARNAFATDLARAFSNPAHAFSQNEKIIDAVYRRRNLI